MLHRSVYAVQTWTAVVFLMLYLISLILSPRWLEELYRSSEINISTYHLKKSPTYMQPCFSSRFKIVEFPVTFVFLFRPCIQWSLCLVILLGVTINWFWSFLYHLNLTYLCPSNKTRIVWIISSYCLSRWQAYSTLHQAVLPADNQ